MTDSRIIRFHETGGPEKLLLETVDVPPPREDELRIRVAAIGLNRADTYRRAGRSGGPTGPFPSGIGQEASGIVEDVGSAVQGFAAGDVVGILPGVSPLPFGTYADRVIVRAEAVVHQPPGLSHIEAAALWATHLTAYAPLVEIARVKRDDVVLLPAASSGVGVAAITIVKAMGGIPVALTRRRAKAATLYELGAAEVIVTDEEDIGARVRAITRGKGARIGLDPIGGRSLSALLDALAIDGILVQYGNLAGEPALLPPSVLIHNLTIAGYALDIGRNPKRRERALRFIMDLVAQGTIRPVVGQVFALEDAPFAHATMEKNLHIGKLVLTTMDQTSA